MRVLEAASWSTKAHNEDACGFRADGLWVIDGASALEPGPPIEGLPAPAWLSSVAAAYLSAVDWDGIALTEVLAGLVGHVAERGRACGLPAAGTARSPAFPTAAVSVVRRRGELLDLCLLGDVPVVLASTGGRPEVFRDPQFADVEEGLLEPVRADLDRGHEPQEAYRRAHTVLLERRRRRNTPEGLWILGDVRDAAWHAYSRTLRLHGGEELLVMSDGFARVIAPFGLVDGYRSLMAAVRRGAAADLLRRLREAEVADATRSRHPRFGVSDDATVVYAAL